MCRGTEAGRTWRGDEDGGRSAALFDDCALVYAAAPAMTSSTGIVWGRITTPQYDGTISRLADLPSYLLWSYPSSFFAPCCTPMLNRTGPLVYVRPSSSIVWLIYVSLVSRYLDWTRYPFCMNCLAVACGSCSCS